MAGCLAALVMPAADTNVFSLHDGDRVALVGDGLLGREQLFGHLELLCVTHYPQLQLTFRNFADGLQSSAREASAKAAAPAAKLAGIKDALLAFKPTVAILGYGQEGALAGPAGVTNLAANLAEVMQTLRVWLGATKAPRLAFTGPFRRNPIPAGFTSVEGYEQSLAEAEQSLMELAQHERARFVPLLEPLDNRNYVPAPPALADGAGRFNDYGYRRLAEGAAMGFGWEPHFWQVGVLTGGAIREGQFGGQFSEVNWQTNQVRITIQEEQLPRAPWSPGEPSRFLKTPPIRMQFAGLARGNYLLKVDGEVIERVSHAQCASALRYARGPQYDQAEQVRQAIRRKNELVFHRAHPQEACPFPEHATAAAPPNADELDRLIQAEEARIARLRQPVKHRFEVVPATTDGAPAEASAPRLPLAPKP